MQGNWANMRVNSYLLIIDKNVAYIFFNWENLLLLQLNILFLFEFNINYYLHKLHLIY